MLDYDNHETTQGLPHLKLVVITDHLGSTVVDSHSTLSKPMFLLE